MPAARAYLACTIGALSVVARSRRGRLLIHRIGHHLPARTDLGEELDEHEALGRRQGSEHALRDGLEALQESADQQQPLLGRGDQKTAAILTVERARDTVCGFQVIQDAGELAEGEPWDGPR